MTIVVIPVDGVGEIEPGDDLAALIARHGAPEADDVVVVTSKVVSKAAGLATRRDKDELLAEQTDRIVARREQTRIVRTHHGLTLAAAGIDASNTEPGTLLPLPADPDAEARALRARLRELTGLRLAVIVSDTAGRPWRVGQTDIAIGCAGLMPFESFAGRVDPYGNDLAVTAPAIADQLAGAAELASGKFGRSPFVIIRGTRPAWHLEADGPGASALIRDEDGDLFGLGAREAVLSALAGRRRGFGAAETEAAAVLAELLGPAASVVAGEVIEVRMAADDSYASGVLAERARVAAVALGVEIVVSTPDR